MDSITSISCHQFVQIYEHGPRTLINNQSSASFTWWENVWMFDLKQNTHFCSPWSMLPYDAVRKSQVALQLFFLQPSSWPRLVSLSLQVCSPHPCPLPGWWKFVQVTRKPVCPGRPLSSSHILPRFFVSFIVSQPIAPTWSLLVSFCGI